MKLSIGKIVGSQKDKEWSQIHVFQPKEAKQQAYGSLLSAVSFSVKDENLEISSFGKEIIMRLHENYYGSGQSSSLLRLSDALKALKAEFEGSLDLSIQAMAVLPKAIYLAVTSGQAYLWRKQELYPLLKEVEGVRSVSGFWQTEDKIVLGSSRFFEIIPPGVLKANLSSGSIERTVELLAPIIHAHEKNSLAVAVFSFFDKSIITEKSPILPVLPRRLNLRQKGSGILSFFQKLKKSSSYAFNNEKREKNAKKTTLLAAGILIFLLFLSVVFGWQKKQKQDLARLREKLIQPALNAIAQGREISPDNPLQAKQILEEAGKKLEESLPQKEEELNVEIRNTLDEIKKEISAVTGLQEVDTPDLFLDLSLIEGGVTAKNMSYDGKNLTISTDKQTVLIIDGQSKEYEKVKMPVEGGQLLYYGQTAGGQRSFFLTDKNLLVQSGGKTIQTINSDWTKPLAMTVFEGNVYILEENSVLKLIAIDDGLSQPRDYLKDESGWTAKDMAIDGYVWVLGSDGLVYKYISGKRDNFVLLGIDELSDDLLIYMDKLLDSVYLLDRQNTRLYQLDKSGEYQKSFSWSGMAGVIDFTVSEEAGQIYLLTKDRIYSISL